MSDVATAVAVGIVLAAQLGMVAVVVRELRAIRSALSDAPEKPVKPAEKSRHSVITPYINDRRIGKR